MTDTLIQTYCDLVSLAREPAAIWHAEDIVSALRWGAAIEAIAGGRLGEEVPEAKVIFAVSPLGWECILQGIPLYQVHQHMG